MTTIEKFLQYKITYMLILINVLVYIYASFLSMDIIDMNMKVLVKLGALFGPITVLDGQWQDLGIAMFLHGGMTHLLMNMFSLFLIGRTVEQYFSVVSYISIYSFAGLIGGLASLYMHPVSVGVGASGAIFGIFGALAGFFLAHRAKIEAHTKAFMKDFGIILGINLVLGFSIESIDVSAHIGGLIVGIIGGYVISKNSKLIWGYSVVMVVVMIAIMSYLPSQYAQALF